MNVACIISFVLVLFSYCRNGWFTWLVMLGQQESWFIVKLDFEIAYKIVSWCPLESWVVKFLGLDTAMQVFLVVLSGHADLLSLVLLKFMADVLRTRGSTPFSWHSCCVSRIM